MHRCRVLLSAVAVLLLGVLAPQAQPVAVAQETTPSADMSEERVDLAWLAPGPPISTKTGTASTMGPTSRWPKVG